MSRTKKTKAAAAETVPEMEIPQDPYQDLMEPEPAEDVPIEYAVTGCDYLNLRQGPSLDAPILVRLPQGVGVSDTGEVHDEWWEVTTGRLTGWVMSKYLEPVWS